jgi:hypothetical protein
VNKNDDWRNKEYVLPFTKTTLLEVFFAIYGCMAVFISIFTGNSIYAIMMAIPTIGFIYVAYLSIVHSSSFKKNKQTGGRNYAPAIAAGRHIVGSTSTTMTTAKGSMDNGNGRRSTRIVNQKLVLAGVLAFLTMGAGIAYYGYQNTMYILDKAVGFIARAETAQSPEQIAQYIKLTQNLIPTEGNPVWLFPTSRTDFALIQADLDSIVLRADLASAMDPHSEIYNVVIRDMHVSTESIKTDLLVVIPYTYISLTNVILAGLWVAIIIAIFAAMRKVNKIVQYKTV